jgi:uncharacterized protein (DUF1810 family)
MPMMNDPFKFSRFVDAQRPVYSRVLEELRAGRKTSHWMWFVFPQVRGLGRSEMAEHYALLNKAEARAYLEHRLLGPRLKECVQTLLMHHDRSALEILGSPDDLKLRSCLTVFIAVAPDAPVFQQALDWFYSGQADGRTLALLQRAPR